MAMARLVTRRQTVDLRLGHGSEAAHELPTVSSVNRPAGFLCWPQSTQTGINPPPVNFQAGMQQPGILQPAEADSLSIGHRRFTEVRFAPSYLKKDTVRIGLSIL